jgi:LAO/AO transport system kinase
MTNLSNHPNAFIRPTPAGKSLGGVARYTRETIILCEAAGFDTILIETVGVGQSETMVASMVDLFLLLILPGAGDDLQGIKRGVVEMADMILVNKADGERVQAAKLAQSFYLQALHLFPVKENGLPVKVLTCSSVESKGISETWEEISQLINNNLKTGFFEKKREIQLLHWFRETIQNNLFDSLLHFPGIDQTMQDLQKQILAHKISPFVAADVLLKHFFDQLRNQK